MPDKRPFRLAPDSITRPPAERVSMLPFANFFDPPRSLSHSLSIAETYPSDLSLEGLAMVSCAFIACAA